MKLRNVREPTQVFHVSIGGGEWSISQPAFTCPKSTVETPEQCVVLFKVTKATQRWHWRRSSVFIVDFEQMGPFNSFGWTRKVIEI